MSSLWQKMAFSDAVEVNPRRPITRGTLAPFVDMASLPAETRDVTTVRIRPVGSGGSRFTNGDTLFARISVCQKTPLSELSCHDPPHFPRQLQPNFVQEDASDRSGWGDWWWTGPDLRNAAIGRRSRLLGSGFKG